MNFENMAAYRRAGTVSLTPRVFVDGLIQVLLDFSHYEANGANGGAPAVVDSASMEPRIGSWGFFTNHALLLLSITMDSTATVREMAMGVGVTERAVVAILNQLEEDGIIIRHYAGDRRNRPCRSSRERRSAHELDVMPTAGIRPR